MVESFAHETLDRVDGALGVSNGLTLGGVTYLAFASVDKRYYRRCSVASFAVRNHDGVVAFEYGNAAVGGSEVDTYDLSHNVVCVCVILFCF